MHLLESAQGWISLADHEPNCKDAHQTIEGTP